MIIDTSALLAVFFDEPRGAWVAECMDRHAGSLRMSTVNLAETLIRVRDRQPSSHASIERQLLAGSISFVPPSVAQAQRAAEARLRYPLNLGDCFAYALAILENEPLLTLDSDFARTDVQLVKG